MVVFGLIRKQFQYFPLIFYRKSEVRKKKLRLEKKPVLRIS